MLILLSEDQNVHTEVGVREVLPEPENLVVVVNLHRLSRYQRRNAAVGQKRALLVIEYYNESLARR